MIHSERHHSHRTGWLRPSVLGANDGVLSTGSLLIGVAAAHASHGSVLVAGAAALIAGAMSMATGEYVSVSSQADTEQADLKLERQGLEQDFGAEREELAAIYVGRGLTADVAEEVAKQLMAHDALGAHARDELGITDTLRARPLQAALASAASFTVGALVPLVVAAASTDEHLGMYVAAVSLAFLAFMGGLAARAGGASILVGGTRVLIWGALTMSVSAGVGRLLAATF